MEAGRENIVPGTCQEGGVEVGAEDRLADPI